MNLISGRYNHSKWIRTITIRIPSVNFPEDESSSSSPFIRAVRQEIPRRPLFPSLFPNTWKTGERRVGTERGRGELLPPWVYLECSDRIKTRLHERRSREATNNAPGPARKICHAPEETEQTTSPAPWDLECDRRFQARSRSR